MIVSPALFAAQAVAPAYFFNYELTATMGSDPEDAPVAYNNPEQRNLCLAISLCVLLGLLEVFWLAAISYCLWTTWVTARKRRPLSHADDLPLQMNPWKPLKRRWCPVCHIYKGARTYHCKPLGVCLASTIISAIAGLERYGDLM